MTFKLFSTASSLALLGLAGLSATTASAQDNKAASTTPQNGGLTEIVVTAQKRSTNLQKTPIAISVMNSQDLINRHDQSLEDFSDGSIPALRVEPFFTRSSALIVSMRGIGAMTDANQPNRDQGVGVYIDGVYLGLAQGLGSALFDVSQIEVARGPQGSLYGRNTEGGAISMTSKKPSGVLSMDTTLGASNYGGESAQTHINLPSFDGLSLKIDAVDTLRNGTTNNALQGQANFNAYDKHGGRLSMNWKANDDLSFDYAYDRSYNASTPYYAQILQSGPYLSSAYAPLDPAQPKRASISTFEVPLQYSIGLTSGHALTMNWTLSPNVKVKSITSYRDLTQSQYDDGETDMFGTYTGAGNTFGRYSLANFWQNQFSQEFQLIGNTSELTYVAGLFYYQEHVHDNAWTPNPLKWTSYTSYQVLSNAFGLTPFPDRASHAHSVSVGAYGQATWTPHSAADMFHLTLGGRFTQDHKMGDLDEVNGGLPVEVVNGAPVVGVIGMDKTWTRFDPTVIASLTPTSDIDLYAKYSTGYKAGGANSRSLTYRTFDPESVVMNEIGAKSEFFDHHVRFNFDVFDGLYKNAQIDFNAVFAIGTSNRATIETTNAAGSGHTSGFESDASWAITHHLTLSASFAHTDVTLPQAPNPFANNLLTNVYAINTPRNASSVALDYNKPIDNVVFRAHLDDNMANGYRASQQDPTLTDKSYIVNGRLAISDIKVGSQSARLQISLWSRNMGNEQNTIYKSSYSTLGVIGVYNEPRTYGVELNMKY